MTMTAYQWRRYTVRTAIYVVLILLSLVFLTPVYLVIVTSLKDPSTINLPNTWNLPQAPYWQSFSEVVQAFGPRLQNSVALVIGASMLSSILGSLNGYIFAKWRIPGEKYLFPLMLFGMFIPYQAILIPLFDFMRSINLYGGVIGLIIIHTVYGLPITTLIFRNFYVDIPDEMLEAAAIDGADFFGIYQHVVFPLSIPGFVVVVIWQFTQIWNEFLFGVTMTNADAQPITVGLAQLAGGEAVKWNLPMAGAIVAALPPLLVYIILGRYFIRGLLAGSIKG